MTRRGSEPDGREPEPPWLGRLLVRLGRVGPRRDEIEADLRELFVLRAAERGRWHAAFRYCVDALSLWTYRPGATVEVPNRRSGLLDDFVLDVRFAVRMFRRQIGAASVTVLGLALAIGATSVVFGFVDAVVFPPAELGPHAASLGEVTTIRPDGRTSSLRSPPEYRRLRDGARLVELEAHFREGALLGEADLEDVRVTLVSGGFFETLGVGAALGRVLIEADDATDAVPAAVMNHTFWKRGFGGDESIVGRTIRLMGVPVTVVGVVEEGFVGPTGGGYPPALWVPLGVYGRIWRRDPTAELPYLWLLGRVDDGTTRQRAEAELSTLVSALEAEQARGGESHEAGSVHHVRLESFAGGPTGSVEWWVFAGVAGVLGLVLLLACTNVANLLLANAVARRREVGLRRALGASRGRLVRQLLTESVLLGLLGGGLGLLFVVWALPLMGRLADLPATLETVPDLRIYGFVVTVTLLAGCLAGLAPARHGVRRDLAAPLRGNAGSGGFPGTPGRAGSLLVATQAAASVMLLVLAALFARTVARVTQADLGADVDRLVLVSAQLRAAGYDAAGATRYWARALERVTELPGVERGALAEYPPFVGAGYTQLRRRHHGVEYRAHHQHVSAGFFATVGIPIVRGRTFTAAEMATDAPVAIVSERLARWLWEGEDPLGGTLDRVEFLGDEDPADVQVVGIVADVVSRLEDPGTTAALYRPLRLEQALRADLVARTRDDPATMLGPVVRAMRALDPEVLPVGKTAREGVLDAQRPLRLLAASAGALGALALGLAIVGVFAVTAFAVEQRTGEIGVRMAVGASVGDVFRLMLRDSLWPVVAGLGVGLLVALGLSRFLSAVLYGVSPHDPLSIAAAVGLLLGAAALAAAVPTRRAAGVDPVEVLRHE